MRLGRAFVFIRRFNSLIPIGAMLAVSAALGYTVFKDADRPHSFIAMPDSDKQSKSFLKLRRHEFVDASSTWVLTLDEVSGKELTYEGTAGKSKNILVSNSNTGASHWIFPDQSKQIYFFEVIKDNTGTINAIFLNTSSAKEQSKNGLDLEDAYLSHPYEGQPTKILSGVLNVVAHRVSGNEIHIIYERQDSLRSARFSLKSFNLLSDHEIAKVAQFK